MITAISELKRTHKEVEEVLKYLAEYEDGVDADYSHVAIDYRWLLSELNHRKRTLELRVKK